MRSIEQNERPCGQTEQFSQRVGRNARPIKNIRTLKEAPQNYERTGHWTEKQNAKYYAFLQKFQDKFSQKQSRRQHKVFKMLAQFIRTRNPNQCRSHHHKMQRNYLSIEETLNSLLKRRPNLESRTERYIQQLNKLQSCFFTEANEKRNQEFQNQKGKIPKNQRLNQPEQDSALESEDLGKKDNIANMKTGSGYEDEQVPQYYNEPQLQYSAPSVSQSYFSTNQHQPYFFENIYQHPYSNYNEYNQQNFNMHQDQIYRPMLTPRQEKAIQAHECFTRWITKLSTLMYKTQSQLGTYTSLPQNNKNINYTPYF